MKSIQRPRGTRDFSPEELAKRRWIEQGMRELCKLFGYRELATPAFENAELFIKKSGEPIVKQLYTFKDKGGRALALRPELTLPVMRFYAQELQALPKPLKLFYFGSCYRYEEPQKARYREFWHFGAECIGGRASESEAEIIALAVKLLENAGLKNFELRVGNLNFLRALLERYHVRVEKQSSVLSLIDKKDFGALRNQVENSEELVQTLTQGERIFENRELLKDNKIRASVLELKDLLKLLSLFEVKDYTVDLSIARGLEYYTGIVFEIDCKDLGAEKQVCGGGSYSLAEIFGAEKIFTTGFALGFDRVLLALEEQGAKFPEEKIEVFVIPVGDEAVRKKALALTTSLRKNGISSDADLAGRNITKNLAYASNIGAKKVILLGEAELKENCASVRDMVSGKQEKVKINKLAEYLMASR